MQYIFCCSTRNSMSLQNSIALKLFSFYLHTNEQNRFKNVCTIQHDCKSWYFEGLKVDLGHTHTHTRKISLNLIHFGLCTREKRLVLFFLLTQTFHSNLNLRNNVFQPR